MVFIIEWFWLCRQQHELSGGNHHLAQGQNDDQEELTFLENRKYEKWELAQMQVPIFRID